MDALLHAHSGLRYIVLLLLLIAIFQGFMGMSGKKVFTNGNRKIALFAMISCHIQLLLGLVLYFFGNVGLATITNPALDSVMGNSLARFWGVEHITGMILAIALITIGHSKSKKANEDKAKFKKIAIFFTLGLIIIFATIPWPFREAIARGWF